MRLVAQQIWMLLLLAVALIFVTPNIVYAQLGGLSNMAKGKAAEALTNEVMNELEKKFTEAVAKEPISEAAKAAVVKKLSEMARPIVKKFVDGAASGRPPNPAELAQTVMKEVMPRLPGLVAAAKMEGGAGTTAASAQGPGGAVPAQQAQPANMPKIAVYVFGAEDPATNKATATRLTAALSNSGRYQAADEYREFFERAVKEQGGTASLNSEQIKRLGGDLGAEYVCVAEITAALGEKQISAFIINAETGVSVAMGVAESPMKTLSEVADVAERVVSEMFKNAPPPVYTQNTTQARQETAADVTAPIESAAQESKQTWWYNGVEYTEGKFGVGVPVRQEYKPCYGMGCTYFFYFTPKYQTPLGTPVSWGGINLEIGWVWESGGLFGIDGDFGLSINNKNNGILVGGGLSLGKEFDLGNQMTIAVGGSVGCWCVSERESFEYYDAYYKGFEDAYKYNESFNFLAPFVKWRWRSLEIMYRGLLGTYAEKYESLNGVDEKGFGYNNHQLMVGYYIGGKKNR